MYHINQVFFLLILNKKLWFFENHIPEFKGGDYLALSLSMLSTML